MRSNNPHQAANSLAAYRLDRLWSSWIEYEDWLEPEARAILWELYRQFLRDFEVVNALYYLWCRNHSMRPKRLQIEAPKVIA